MLLSHCHSHNLLSTFPFALSSPLNFLHKPITILSVSGLSRPTPRPDPWLAQASHPTTSAATPTPTPTSAAADEGPVELPSFSDSIFSATDDPSPIQVATSVLLTGAITVFLFRSIRRRAKRSKELRFRSSGAKKSLKEEAMDSLKAMGSASIGAESTPSALQALFGGISAGVIALILYKFTTTIEASLNRQTISENFSVRQITITIRTIINGLCYLATFVFGFNSVGLFLYSGQLALNSLMEDSSTKNKGEEKLSSPDIGAEISTDSNTLDENKGDQNSDDTQ